MSFITNYIQNTAATYLAAGVTAAGSMAGNAVGGVGSLIEQGGRSVGEGSVQGGISSVGNYINSYGDRVIAATAPSGSSAAKKVAIKPSTSGTSTKKALPAAGTKQKALPAPYSNGVQKALPAPTPKTKAPPTPSVTSAKSAVGSSNNGKVSISKESRPRPVGSAVGVGAKPANGGVVGPKPMGAGNGVAKNAPVAKSAPSSTASKTQDGKVRISAASKPKPVGAVGGAVKR